jgi:hypothetical protein
MEASAALANSTDNGRAIPYDMQGSSRSILVIGDRIAGYDRYSRELPLSVSVLLSHFTPHTRWLFADQVTVADVASADAVVYLGDSQVARVPAATLVALQQAKRLVLADNHLEEFRDAHVAFQDVLPGVRGPVRSGTSVRYGSHTFPYAAESYNDVRGVPGSQVIAALTVRDTSVPFVIRDGNATYINGAVDFGDDGLDPASDGYELVIADAFRDALGFPPVVTAHLAMLRLEDVSVETPVDNLREIVELLSEMHVPYGIGVIPDQWVAGKKLKSLDQDRGLVTVLAWAQTHGATIVLHGLYHSFHSSEDFEFWDAAHDRPLSYDSAAWMDGRISEGLRDEHGVGLDPVMWETPHYAASPVDYSETAKFFTTVWEQRPPLGWSPWILQRDQYGQRVLPEDLGYIAVDGDVHESLQSQMERARALLICRECIAAGFLHPSTVSPDTVRRYVDGLRALGYAFADPATYVAHTPILSIAEREQTP